MALFLRGKFAGFYKAGASECVKDVWRCYPSNGKVSIMMTRRDMESTAQRFWKAENTTITFYPINEEEPRMGGKVQAKVMGLDVRTFMPYTKTYFGVYGEDFVTYGQFANAPENIRDNDETLIKLFDENDTEVVDKFTFKFNDNQVSYSRQVNGEHLDTDLEHSVEESVLTPHVEQTWSETFFYGAGNKNV